MNIAFIYEDDEEVKQIKDRIKKIYDKSLGKVKIKDIMNDHYKNIVINSFVICIPEYKFNKLNKKFIKNLIYILRNNGIKILSYLKNYQKK